MPLSGSKAHLAYYRSQHSTLGCKLTHLLGIPLIAVSLPIMLVDRKKGLYLFSLGWLLQFIGHFVFERNSPVLLTRSRHPYTVLAAIVFVGEEWFDTFRSIKADLIDAGEK